MNQRFRKSAVIVIEEMAQENSTGGLGMTYDHRLNRIIKTVAWVSLVLACFTLADIELRAAEVRRQNLVSVKYAIHL
jgi:hypothetical protein